MARPRRPKSPPATWEPRALADRDVPGSGASVSPEPPVEPEAVEAVHAEIAAEMMVAPAALARAADLAADEPALAEEAPVPAIEPSPEAGAPPAAAPILAAAPVAAAPRGAEVSTGDVSTGDVPTGVETSAAASPAPLPPAVIPASAAPSAGLPVALDEAGPEAPFAPVRRNAASRIAFTPERLDLLDIGATIAGYVRGEGAAAAAHIRALSGARSPADVIRLQVGEAQRAADASLTCWSAVARKASRLFALR